ncbi:FAD-binding protein [Novosphingobium sp. M1R2S20]|uniref:FAD-binding protein n=1 Tax=Novosphingobium rhizovicinum TaxID=3228928 RepID=A0ABV3RFV0_9SPHN
MSTPEICRSPNCRGSEAMTITMQPSTAEDVRECVLNTLEAKDTVEIRGGGTKAGFGKPVQPARILDMRGLSGIVDYDPPELVLTVLPGTPLTDVRAALNELGQALAFDPFDHGPVYGMDEGAATIGGVVAAGVAGSQRLTSGSARDHLLGFKAVSGRGEAFVGGAKVVKNVTGYDLPKIMAGSWGRLAVLTELTLKVLPKPPERLTLALRDLPDDRAVAVMARALGSPAEVAAAAHVIGDPEVGTVTLLRLQGVRPSVAARALQLEALLGLEGEVQRLPEPLAARLWKEVTNVTALGTGPLWRISVPPTAGPAIARRVREMGGRYLLDWGGGLVCAVVEGESATLRTAAREAGGHATLVRADPALRAETPAFHPAPVGVAALEERVRRSFDPQGIFETGRF